MKINLIELISHIERDGFGNTSRNVELFLFNLYSDDIKVYAAVIWESLVLQITKILVFCDQIFRVNYTYSCNILWCVIYNLGY